MAKESNKWTFFMLNNDMLRILILTNNDLIDFSFKEGHDSNFQNFNFI